MASNSPTDVPTQGEEKGTNVLVYDTEDGYLNVTRTDSTTSKYNDFHVSLGVSLIEDLLQMHEKFPSEDDPETLRPGKVVILTFYSGQAARYNKVKRNMKAAGVRFVDNLDILTVDAAAGGEWDFGIIDCTFGPRADFLTKGRMSTALTRCRSCLMVMMNMTQIAALPADHHSKWIKACSNYYRTHPESCQVLPQPSRSYVHSPWFPISVDINHRPQTHLPQAPVGSMAPANPNLATATLSPPSSIDRTFGHYFPTGITSVTLIDNAGTAGKMSAFHAATDSLYHQYSHKLERQPSVTEMGVLYNILNTLSQPNAQGNVQPCIDRVQKAINVFMEKFNMFAHIFTVTSDGVVCATPMAVPQGHNYIALFISSNATEKEQTVVENSHFRAIKPTSTEAFVVPTPAQFRIVA